MATEAPFVGRRATIVTGAAGFAGRHLLARLAGSGPLVGWTRPGGTPPATMPGVTWKAVDVTSRRAVESAIRQVAPARIYHLAGAASVESSFRNAVPHLQVNALGTHHVLESVRTLDLSCRVLVVTSAQVYAAADTPLREDGPLLPQSPYGLTKLAQDQVALAAAGVDHLDVVVARPFNHIGPGQGPGFAIASFARQIALAESGAAPPLLRVGNLETHRDITDVRDVAAAYEALMARGRAGRAYNVCSGHTHCIRELLDALRRRSTVDIAVETDPARFRPADVPVVRGDATRIHDELDWAPRIPIDQTLADTLDDWRGRIRTEP